MEGLEDRCLLSNIVEYPVPGGFGGPQEITAGADGNLWFTQAKFPFDTIGSNHAGRITTNGSISEFPIPEMGTVIPQPASGLSITAGPDGNLWYTEIGLDNIARLSPSGTVTEFSLPESGSDPAGITAGPDGNVWFTEAGADKIGRMNPAGVLTEFAVPTSNSSPLGITVGPDHNLWFTEANSNKIGRITVSGSVKEFQVPTTMDSQGNVILSGLRAITSGPDGNLWFVEGDKIGRITPTGTVTEFSIPTANSFPKGITGAPDGNVWFTESMSNKIGRIGPDGTVTEFAIPTAKSNAGGIAVGPDGNLWFTEGFGDTVGKQGADSQIGEVVLNFPPTQNGRFVVQLYIDILHRLPEAAGLAFWTGLLNVGTARDQVVQGIENSPESRTDVVQHIYHVFLHRAADPSGAANSLAFLTSGGTVEQLEARTAGSTEYFQVRGGGTNDGFLDAVYQDALGRAVDPAGRSTFDQALTAGATPAQVAAIMVTSLEFQQDLVNGFYGDFLNRSADPSGLNAWVSALQSGKRDDQVIVGFLSSDEYFAHE